MIESTAMIDVSEECELGTTFVRRCELGQAGIAPVKLDCGTLFTAD